LCKISSYAEQSRQATASKKLAHLDRPVNYAVDRPVQMGECLSAAELGEAAKLAELFPSRCETALTIGLADRERPRC